MRISVTVFVILISTYLVNASVLDPVIENVVHRKITKPPPGVSGIWKKKTIWKPRWVKEWKSAKVMKPVWRKVWSPVQIREWLPIPKPPPGWDAISTPLAPIHPQPQKGPPKDSLGHDSFPVHSSTTLPLWDPVPYPESQQPPPPPPSFAQPLPNVDSCGTGGCDNSPSHTFNHNQILEILGPRYQTPEYPQNPEYSETVNHLTRLPPEGWPLQPLPSVQYNNYQPLPEFLVPPKTLPGLDFRPQPVLNAPPGHPPGLDAQNGNRWTPLPPENKLKGHFITKPPEHPYKFQLPEVVNRNITNQRVPDGEPKDVPGALRPQPNGDFIQEAQLVGEYHYSEFDLPNAKPEPRKPHQQEDQVKVKPQVSKPLENQQKPTTTTTTTQKPIVRPKQTQTPPEVKTGQSGSHVQKKHIPSLSSKPNHNFHQQEAFIKEIFPVFKPLQNYTQNLRFELFTNVKNDLQKPNPSTKLVQVEPKPQSDSTNSKFEKPKEIYPIYERPQTVTYDILPPNHKPSLLPEVKQQEKPFLANPSQTTKLIPVPSSEPEPTKTENPLFDKANTVQLVFATTPDDYNRSQEEIKKTTTTEPYEVVFSSSLQSTTEAVTKSPVIIVTPISFKS